MTYYLERQTEEEKDLSWLADSDISIHGLLALLFLDCAITLGSIYNTVLLPLWKLTKSLREWSRNKTYLSKGSPRDLSSGRSRLMTCSARNSSMGLCPSSHHPLNFFSFRLLQNFKLKYNHISFLNLFLLIPVSPTSNPYSLSN